MKKQTVHKHSKELVNRVFWKSLNPMSLTDGPLGTFLDVNDAFLKHFGFKRKDVIGKTVVETGLVTYKRSLSFVKEVKEKGFAKNIQMELRAPDNRIHFVTINTIPLVTEGEECWLTIGTETPSYNRTTKMLQHDIIKLFDSYKDGGVIAASIFRNKKASLLYANKEAKKILKKYSLDKLASELGNKGLIYFKIGTESYYARNVGKLDSPTNIRLIIIYKFPFNINYEQIFEELHFTPRQQEVALLVVSGDSYAQIAKKLFISEYTVKDHMKEIRKIIGVSRRSELFPKLMKLR
jgi:PAS domain S-box-containing protein